VGGKVGVDLTQGKNLVGAFKQPTVVLIDVDVLATLPAREWRCGMAEVIKHGLLADPELLEPELHTPDRAEELVARAVQVKVDVVQRDPFEHGERAHLNLGHTFGHAIERVTEYAIPHGEAVAIGLVAAVRLSERLGLCDSALTDHVEMLLSETGLPTRTGGLDAESLWEAMATDKKWQSGRSRFVLLHGLAQPAIVEGIAKADIVGVLEDMR
jgi:3-dehydroquinate synthetase